MTLLKKKNDSVKKITALEQDKKRTKVERKKKNIAVNQKRNVKKTTMDTLPYEYFVSEYVMLLKSNVRVNKELTSIYSKTYKISDTNYHSLTEEEQLEKLQVYIEFLNGFDSNTSLQISIVNSKINIEDFENNILIKENDQYKELIGETNELLSDKIMHGKNGLRCRKYITVTVLAVDFETANSRFYTMESHLYNSLNRIGIPDKCIRPLTANEHVRLLADILRNPNDKISAISRKEFARQEEKMLCCPDYFEFKRDYFMFNDKFARCMYFRRLPSSIIDTLYKELTELNMEMIVTQNVEFVDPDEAKNLLKRKITDMKQEEIIKTRRAADVSKGGFVDPIEGTQLAIDKQHAQEFLDDLQHRNQKMTLCQFIIMFLSDSYEEMIKNTEALAVILRTYQIDYLNAPFRQEPAFASALPVGNSCSYDKENNLQVRRTLSSESTAAFVPFNAKELMHKGGLWYGENILSGSTIIFDRNELTNPNGFIFGIPGSGKSVTTKLEIMNSVLATNDEIIILDPEREYSALAELLGGEIIHISANSHTHINPLDLTENPDPNDSEYDPIKSKFDFLLSFFSAMLGNIDISPIQKTVIDAVMNSVYEKYKRPTLKEYYKELKEYEEKSTNDNTREEAAYLREALHLYVYGSLNVFSKESNVDINKRIVVYDIKDLGNNIQSVGMTIVLENIWDRVAKNRAKGLHTRIYVDEMYLMFKNEHSANFFYELYKRARKWGGIPTGITQNVDDVLRSPIAKTMIENTKFVVMLSLNSGDRNELAKLLKIPNDTMKYVTNSKPGSGLIFADEFGTSPFEHIIPKDTKIYKVITTKFAEKLD